jgi:hypothetical protein
MEVELKFEGMVLKCILSSLNDQLFLKIFEVIVLCLHGNTYCFQVALHKCRLLLLMLIETNVNV